MKPRSAVNFRNICLTGVVTLGQFVSSAAWAKPSIQSIAVTPDPLPVGQSFIISVMASPDVTAATASVDFRPGSIPTMDITLTKHGQLWTGVGVVPSGLNLRPHKDEAKVKVLVVDSALHHDQEAAHFNVTIPPVSAVFAGGVLTITGNDDDNIITASRDAAGNILVNGGAVPVTGGAPTVANTSLVRIFGLGGNDLLTIDEANGLMPAANLVGGDGDDTLIGGSGDDTLDGGPGNDTLIGRAGNDVLSGGPGKDSLTGGQGADTILGGDGDDQIIWNPGDGSDVVEGEGGVNTLIFNGSNVSESVDLSANGQRLRFSRNIASVVQDCSGIQQVIFRALGGADTVVVNDLTGTQVTNVIVDLFGSQGDGDSDSDMVFVNGTTGSDHVIVSGSVTNTEITGLSASVSIVGAEPALDSLTVNGLAGDDVLDASTLQAGAIALTLNGGPGNDVLSGGEGNDVLIGGQGNDTLLGGPGDDVFIWNPGDASDVIEGQDGQDQLVFNGANISESIQLSANGQRLRFTRDIASVTLDCSGVESVRFNALGGSDNINIGDLTGTGVTNVSLDLGSPIGSGQGDTQIDAVTVNGTPGEDVVTVAGSAQAGVSVLGLPAAVEIVGADPTLDQLTINLLEGDDIMNASGLPAGVINLIADGGPGDDVLVGSDGADVLTGGEGDDILEGGPGQDLLDGGPGNNILIQD